MIVIPYVAAYAAILIFLIAVIARFVMWARLPLHLRWELYPVAHEGTKARYGGSYLEETDWWKKPRERSLWGEIKVMAPEIVFLVALWQHNRKMWLRSFPFHFGVYLVIATTLLMLFHGALAAAWPSTIAGGLGFALHKLTVVLAFAGLALGTLGALGLMHGRLTDPDLVDFTAPADVFNLAFFVVAFGTALVHVAVADRDLSQSMSFVEHLVALDPAPLSGDGAWLTGLVAVLLAALLAYIPMTHMSHFVGKYFAYHAIRWNDDPNLPGGRYEARIKELLNRPVSWSAPHIRGGGGKTWAQAATEGVRASRKKEKRQ